MQTAKCSLPLYRCRRKKELFTESHRFGLIVLLWASEVSTMNEPGLDGRHRDKSAPKAGEIQQKRGDTLNKNLSRPIPQFSLNARLSTMRKETGKISEEAVRRAAKKR